MGLSQREKDTLEQAFVDKHSLVDVLVALSEICADKADHLRVDWQDHHSARYWDLASQVLDTVWRKASILAVSGR